MRSDKRSLNDVRRNKTWLLECRRDEIAKESNVAVATIVRSDAREGDRKNEETKDEMKETVEMETRETGEAGNGV